MSFSHVYLVINQKYSVQVHDEYVISGNTAVLRCQVPSYVADYVVVTAWIQDNGLHLYPNTDIGGKYNVLANGDLYINNAGPSDAYTTYSCRTTHKLTGEIQTSTYPGRIIVTEPKGFVQPRINVEKQTIKHAIVNGQIVLACIAQGHPAPSYKWFKEYDDQLMPLTLNDRIFVISNGLLKISKVKLDDSGKYLCWVNNSAGEETIQITLTVTGWSKKLFVILKISKNSIPYSSPHRSFATSSSNGRRGQKCRVPMHRVRVSSGQSSLDAQWKASRKR